MKSVYNKTGEEGSKVLPAIRDGRSGWKDTHMTGVAVSMTMSGCFGFTLLRSRFHVHTYDLSVLQSPSSTLTAECSNDHGDFKHNVSAMTGSKCLVSLNSCYIKIGINGRIIGRIIM